MRRSEAKLLVGLGIFAMTMGLYAMLKSPDHTGQREKLLSIPTVYNSIHKLDSSYISRKYNISAEKNYFRNKLDSLKLMEDSLDKTYDIQKDSIYCVYYELYRESL